jgi:hypothetical protein
MEFSLRLHNRIDRTARIARDAWLGTVLYISVAGVLGFGKCFVVGGVIDRKRRMGYERLAAYPIREIDLFLA